MESMENNNRIEVKPMGSYFDTDSEGYVINPASMEKIQDEWKPVIQDIIIGYKNFYKEHLMQVYLRGSVAKGKAIKRVSDIDSFAYVDLSETEINDIQTRSFRDDIREKYPFLTGVEFYAEPHDMATTTQEQILLNQSVCIYGESVEVQKMKPGRVMMLHTPAIGRKMEKIENFLMEDSSPERMKKFCVKMAKNILRSGFEITMARSGKYTRDLYKCYEGFLDYYPEKEQEMKAVFNLAVNPTGNKEQFKKVVDDILPWLAEEAKEYI